MAQLAPLVPEDLLALRVLTDVQLSPDGGHVAYVVKSIAKSGSAYSFALWIAPTNGSSPARPLALRGASVAAPRWSPDGTTIAFLSDRGGTAAGQPKNVRLHALGGETRWLTEGCDDCAEPAWSPDGRRIAFTRKDPPDHGIVGDGVRAYRTLRYKTDEGHLWDGRRWHVWVADVASGDARKVTDGDWDDASPAWSADGREIAFASARGAGRELDAVADIWVVPAAGGPVRRVTDGQGLYARPSWSPDCARIACLGFGRAADSISASQHVWCWPAAGGGAGEDLLRGWDGTADHVVFTDAFPQPVVPAPAWTPDGARLLFLASVRGATEIHSVSSAGGDARAETAGDQQLAAISFDAARRRYAAAVGTSAEPGDVRLGQIGAPADRRLTRLNRALLGRRWLAQPERIAVRGADGWPIDGWLMRPRGFDESRRWPLVLQIHGGPHRAYGHGFFHEFQVLAGRGYAVLYLNPRGSQSYGEAFAHACVNDWGGKDLVDVMAGLEQVLGAGWVDPARLYVTGGSYGGFLTAWILTQTARFRAAAMQRGISNNVSAFGTSDIGWRFWEAELGAAPWRDADRLTARSPIHLAPRITTPLLILHGERDLRVPMEQAEQLFVALRVHGVEAELVRFTEGNHDLTRGGRPADRVEHVRRIADWFDAHG